MSKKLPILAKISRPRSHDVYLRKRLFRQLDKNRKNPIIWVCGPAGSGKTTLVNSYIETSNLQSLWYQVDSGDGDPATFFHYLGLAAKKAAPRKSSPLPHLMPEYLMGIPIFTRRFFEELYGRLKIPYLVVFDDYHEIPDDSLFHEVMLNGLGVVPKGINVVVISRCEPPPVLERMWANQLMRVISWDDLRLNLDEFKGIVRHMGLKKMSNEMIRELHESTEGWAAGLFLMLEKSKIKNMTVHSLNKQDPEYIFNYFASEIFHKIDKETQDILAQTALLPSITSVMVKRLTGIHHGDRILSKMNKNNFFIERRQSERRIVYQYHAMFRKFLLSRAKELFTPKQLLNMKKKAAMIMEESNRIEDAAGLFIETKDWLCLASLINKNAEQFSYKGRTQTVLKWLLAFPQEVLDKNPWLSYWFGMCYLNFKPSDSVSYFEKAFELFKKKGETKGQILSICGAIRAIFNDTHKYERFDLWLAKWKKINSNFNLKDNPEIEGYSTCSIFIALIFRQQGYPDASLFEKRLKRVLDKDIDLNLRIEILYFLIYYYLILGNLTNAEMTHDSLCKILKYYRINPATVLFAKHAEANYYFFKAMHDPCDNAVKEGLNIIAIRGIYVWEFNLMGTATANLISKGELAEAEKYLDKMTSYIKNNKYNSSFYHMLMGWSSLLKKNLPIARKHMEKSYSLATEVGAVFPLSISNFGMSLVHHELGEQQRAYLYLNNVEGFGRSMKSATLTFMYCLTKAQFAFDLGDKQEGFKYLRKAMSLGRENGFFNFFLWLPDIMLRLCIKALTEGIEVDYVKELIYKRNLIPETPLLDVENWPWSLKIYTLGKFEIVKDGKSIQFSRKAPQKPLAMLKVLIVFGGSDVSEMRISDVLWPDADGDVAYHAFTTTLSRLRKLIGVDKAITLHEGRLSLNPRYCWVDIWAFQRLLEEADEVSENGNNHTHIQIIEKAVSMYQGNFLEGDEEEPWTISLRERLRNRFTHCLSTLGNFWEGEKQVEKAIGYYNRGLEVCDLTEEFYQNLMVCYHKLDRNAEAFGVYKLLKKVLSAASGLNPSQKTEQILNSISRK